MFLGGTEVRDEFRLGKRDSGAMTVKAHKEVQIFKRICTHDSFGDHVEEVHYFGLFVVHPANGNLNVDFSTLNYIPLILTLTT